MMAMVAGLGLEIAVHIDLHETTDTDETEFCPAKAARDGVDWSPGCIPDGFYLVGDTQNPQLEFLKAVIDKAEKGRVEAWTQMVQSLFSTIDFRYVY